MYDNILWHFMAVARQSHSHLTKMKMWSGGHRRSEAMIKTKRFMDRVEADVGRRVSSDRTIAEYANEIWDVRPCVIK